MTTTTTRIYVACLAAYNAGRLHGAWIDIDETTDADAVREAIGEMLAASPIPGAEEYAIHDHEGFGDLIGEYEDIVRVVTLGQAIAQHGEAFAAYASHVGAEYATVEDFEEAYAGEWSSEEEFAQDLAEQLGTVPEDAAWPASYIDWERATRDLFLTDYWSTTDSAGSIYVFRTI